MYKSKNQRGITLIALIITIIILLILAGVTINLTLGENGLFKTAKIAGEKYEEAEAREKLETVLIELQADKVTKTEYNENNYIDNKLNENDMQIEGDIVIVNGWQFEIDRSIPKIVKELGKLTKETMLLPTIIKVDTKTTKNSATVSIKLRNEQGAKITYTIKKDGEENELQRIENQTNLEYTFSNLELGKYIITIHTENEYGEDDVIKEVEVNIPIESITFSETDLEWWTGRSEELVYTVTPEDAPKENIIWTSSNPDILQVDKNGRLTAIAEGTATITATANGVTSSCTIRVGKNLFEYIANSGKTLEELGMSIKKGYIGEYWQWSPSDMQGILGGSGAGVHNWSWDFTVPGNIFNEKKSYAIDSVWELHIWNSSSYVSTCTAEIQVVYEDGEIENVQSDYSVPAYTNRISEYRLTYEFKDKTIKAVTFKAFGYDNDWGGSVAELKAIIY